MLKSKPAYKGSHEMVPHHNHGQKFWNKRGQKEVPCLDAQQNVSLKYNTEIKNDDEIYHAYLEYEAESSKPFTLFIVTKYSTFRCTWNFELVAKMPCFQRQERLIKKYRSTYKFKGE